MPIRKVHIVKKNHTEVVVLVIDLWYLEWQKQEKKIDLIHIMLHYGLFTWKGNCYYSFTDVLVAISVT